MQPNRAALRKHGQALVCHFAVALRLGRLYSHKHQNFAAAAASLEECIRSVLSLEGACSFARVGECLFLNKTRIKTDFRSHQSFRFVLEVLKARDLGEMRFDSELTREEIEGLVTLLNRQVPSREDPWHELEAAAAVLGLDRVHLSRHGESSDLNVQDGEGGVPATEIYFKAITALEAALEAVKGGRGVDWNLLKRRVQTIVDIALGGGSQLLALTNVKDWGSPLANHGVNVAILSVMLGAKVGLTKKLIADLGLAALLHDVGKVSLPEELRSCCREALSGADSRCYEAHVSSGVEKLLQQKVTDGVAKAAIVAFLHHLRFDGTGYPRLRVSQRQNLYTRIVAVADFYDNATAPGRLARAALQGEEVVRAMLDRSGTELDPVVVKAFVNLVGLYAVGCLVRLDTGEVATVVEPPANPRFLDRPAVKVILEPDGSPADRLVDLLEKDEAGGFRRSILKLYEKEAVRLSLNEYLAVL
ncbi:MAG: HD domain-containing protein [Planctomycetes bacterium]|nr:HD domain-containing protein [Planctomycetota bacterium]